MSWRTYREGYYPEWHDYVGKYEIATFNMTGPPEQIAPTRLVARLFELFVTTFRTHGETLMYIKVEYDIAPTWETKYRVTTYSHPGVQFIVGAVLAFLAIIGLTLSIYFITSAVKTTAREVPEAVILIALAVLGLVAIKGMKEYKRAKEA